MLGRTSEREQRKENNLKEEGVATEVWEEVIVMKNIL